MPWRSMILAEILLLPKLIRAAGFVALHLLPKLPGSRTRDDSKSRVPPSYLLCAVRERVLDKWVLK
jgi:hypothetical protein